MTVFALERRDRHAPHALTADAPIGALGHHVVDAVVSPAGDPFHLVVDHVERAFLERGDVDEPLRRGAENDGLVTAPAVRIRVRDLFQAEQTAVGFDHFQRLAAALVQIQASDDGRVGLVMSRGVDGIVIFDVIALSRLEILDAVGRRRMNAAGAGLERDVWSQHERRFAGIHGMIGGEQFQVFALDGQQAFGEIEPSVARHRIGHAVGDQVNFVAHLEKRVVEVGVQRHGATGGQRPGRRRPDHDVHVASFQRRETLRHVVVHLVGDEHRGRRDVGVLDLRRGFGGLAVDAPVHGLGAAVDETFLHDRGQRLELAGLELGLERQIRFVPEREATQALHAFALHVHPFERVVVALGAELERRRRVLVQVLVLEHFQFDGQSVRIPARHVRHVVAAHRLVLDDEILQRLVERVGDVDRPVGVGRPVVEHEGTAVLVALQHFFVNPVPFPELDRFRFFLRQAGAHGKLGHRQLKR